MDMDTVDFQLNFDDSLKEPNVAGQGAPAAAERASGIAVGMANNMPHNPGEIVDAVCAYIDADNITVDELLKHVKGPDFLRAGSWYLGHPRCL